MPNGKPSGVRCANLSADNLCKIFDDPSRPAVCAQFKAMQSVCGNNRDEALAYLIWLEQETMAEVKLEQP